MNAGIYLDLLAANIQRAEKSYREAVDQYEKFRREHPQVLTIEARQRWDMTDRERHRTEA